MRQLILYISTLLTGLLQLDAAFAQERTAYTNAPDSIKLNQDAVYNRPFITMGKSSTAVGGYAEGNTNYFSEDGVSEGLTLEMRRFNIFLYSAITDRIQLISELEFEHGTEEISLETALVDFEVNQALNFRGGILLPQIGLINANHDGPKWEFVERPLSSTHIIPSTLSEIGFGLYGKLYPGDFILSYDAYLTNGLQENIILNEEGKTFIPSGKDPEMFGEDNNGTPMYNARLSLANRSLGEVGLAYYGGTYNRYRLEGENVEPKRNLSMFAIDFHFELQKLVLQGEWVSAHIDVPTDLEEIYGTRQWGGYAEVVYPILRTKIKEWDNATFNLALRAEKIDLNAGSFSATGTKIGDEVSALAGGVSFRPFPSTVIKANYRYHWIVDNLNNPPAHLAGFQFGFATYF